MKIIVRSLLILFLLSSSLVLSQEEDASIEFLISDKPVKTVSLSEMKSLLKAHDIEFYHPNFGKNKKYRGFKLSDVLGLGFGGDFSSHDYPDVAFVALDGYESVSDVSRLNESGGYVVFEDLDQPGWELIDDKKAAPGPFYIVWTGKEQTTANEYPWPWQLSEINLVSFKDSFSKVYPEGAEKSTGVYSGFEIFKGRCVRCHAMDREGGKIGPDLNAPQSIVSYRSEYMIKELIRRPSKYRHTHMPDHPDLTDNDLQNLIEYFKFMDKNRD